MKCVLSVVLFLTLLLPATSASADDQNFISPAASDYPLVPKRAHNYAAFVPKGWKILGKAQGDLNGDGQSDVVLVIKGDFSKFKQKNSGLGRRIFDTNPRLLLILLKDPSGNSYKLAEQTRNIVAGADEPTMDEPFKSVGIKNGVLSISVQSFYSAGGWSASDTTYKFHYRNNHFVLVAAERDELERNTGEETVCNYDFIARKARIASKTIANNLRLQIRRKRLPKRKLKNFSDFKTLYEWQVVPGCYL